MLLRRLSVLVVCSIVATFVGLGATPGPVRPPAAAASDVTPPPTPPAPEQPITGFVETHLHQFANQGFGGLEIWGSPMDPTGDPSAPLADARARALPDSDFLWVDDSQVDDLQAVGGLSARSNPSTVRCDHDCPPQCPPGSGTTDNPCWKVDIHGTDGHDDLLNKALGGKDSGHGTFGYPDMAGWPAWDVYTTQQAYYEWLARAHDHGMQVMTMLAVNNELLCNLGYHRASYGCSDDAAVVRQIQGAKDLEAYIDARAGGPGQGFYRIVRTGDEARAAIKAGKLAVVLGVEVDTPWDCNVNNAACDAAYVETHVQQWHDLGVRVFYPLHVTDNKFGGASLYTGLFDFDNLVTNGSFFDVTTDCPAGIESRLTLRDEIVAWRPAIIALGVIALPLIPVVMGPLIAVYPPMALVAGLLQAGTAFGIGALFTMPGAPGDARSAPDAPDPSCNSRSLTETGSALINSLMDHEMIIDVDHTDARTFDAILDIAESRHYSGIVSGHTGLVGAGLTRADSVALTGRDFDLGDSARHEGNKTDEQVQRIAALGGVVSIILHQGGRDRIKQYVDASGNAQAPFDCGESSQAWAQVYLYATKHLGLTSVGIGSDMNGLAGMPAPRFGADACGHTGDHPPGYAPDDPIAYPFADYNGVSVPQQQFGNRTWDYNTDGFSQVGQYPDFIRDLELDGLSHADLAPLFGSAEAYVQMWEKIDDHTPPTVQCGTVGTDWHASDVSVPCVAYDTGSGLAAATDGSFSLTTSVPVGTETADASTGTHPAVCDRAGNCTGTVPAITGIRVDRKAPGISIAVPSALATYTVGETRLASYSCSDGGSGVASCTGTVANGSPIDTTPGSKTFAVTSSDQVGNASSASASYAVTYRICLRYDPTKAVGGTFPVKLQICSFNGTNLSSSAIAVTAVQLDGAAPPPNFVGGANLGNAFRYDAASATYVYNVSGKGLAAGPHTMTFTVAGDPLPHSVGLVLK